MSKKLYIKSIAHKLKIKPDDLLFNLAEHNIILATVTNGTIESYLDEFMDTSKFYDKDIPISEEIVLGIATDGIWQGKRIIIWHGITKIKEWRNYKIDLTNYGEDDPIGYQGPFLYPPSFTHVTFEEEISLTSNQLFVYEDDFSRIEPILTGQPPTKPSVTIEPDKIIDDAPTKTTACSIVVPRSLWDGKPHTTVRNAMRPKEDGGEGFSDAIIAYVLFNWCGLTSKTQLGRLLGEPNQDDSSYRRLATRLLKKAASLTLTHD